ncbi:MAG: AAA family ATPase, partial [Candidatus Colwellbacteria bacterium]|nr:AAA family ATPase [Candidatus Colwellbacteria bacterium]
ENNFYGGRLTKLREELSGLSKQESKLKEAIHKQELALKKVEEEFNGVSLSEPQALKELKEVQTEREKLLIGRREIERTVAKLEAQFEFEEKNLDLDLSSIRRAVEELRKLVKSLLEEDELSLLKTGIKQVSELIEGLFKSRKVEKSPDLEKNFKKLTADLNSLDKELEALNKKENSQRQLLEGFNQNFRRAYELVEKERKEFEKLREEGSRILLAKERTDTRLIDLREELSQIGLSVEKLEKASTSLPAAEAAEEQALRRMFKLRSELAGIGEVDEALVKEAKETEERYEFLTHQTADLEKAIADLKSLIQELDQKIYGEFSAAIKTINEEFTKLIKVIFGGGKARLVVQEAGVDIEIALPKKKVKGLEVLSGGERSLVSIAALFSLISVSPPPFLVLDEIDAALDENNARRFSQILKEFSHKTQFIVVTHNRATMEAADVLYGVTMSPDGTSKIVSLKLA